MTSLFLPHPAYAEEQPYARTILTFHALRSGFAGGATISVFTAVIHSLFSGFRCKQPLSLGSFGRTALLHSARGTPAGTLLAGIGLWPHMRAKEEIEWQDRAWRLLENQGQVECDWWLLGGAAVGAVAAPRLLGREAGDLVGRALRGKNKTINTGSAVVGGAGLGGVAGMLGYYVRPGSPSRN